MPFPPEIRDTIRQYALADLPDASWHRGFFAFVRDAALASRLGEEFLSTRFLYKVLEGLEAEEWLLRAQIRMQVLSYASIYEAVLHYLLFDLLSADPQVVALTEFPTKKLISIPSQHQAQLEKYLRHDGKEILPTYEAIGHTDVTKVRFDRKAECAFSLGFIADWLRDDLIEFYEARNAIHIHAEIRKNLNYELELSRRAYLRMEPFKDQILVQMSARRLL